MRQKSPIKLILLFLVFLILYSSVALASEITKESIQENVNLAEDLSNEWSNDSYRRSIQLFIQSSEQWKNLGKFDESINCSQKASKIYFILNEFDSSINQSQIALKLNKKFTNNSDTESDIYSLLSLVYLRAGKLKKSEVYSKRALNLSDNSKNPLTRANALFSFSQFTYSYGNAEIAEKLFQKTLFFAEMTHDINLISYSLLYLGFTNIKLGNPTISLRYARKALAKLEETNNSRGKAICYVGLGFIYTMLSEKQEALNSYKKGEFLFPDDFEWLEKGKLFNGLATIYEDFGQLKLAESYRRKALESYQKSKYLNGQLATLPSLANVISLNGNIETARLYYDKASVLAHKLNDEYNLAYINKDLGEIYLKTDMIDKALHKFLETEKIYAKFSTKFPDVQQKIGETYLRKNDLKSARTYFNQSFQIASDLKETTIQSEVLYNLTKLNQIENYPEVALKNITESINLTETLYSDVANSNLKRSYFSSVYERYELFIHLLMQKHKQSPSEDYAIQALQASEKSRSRSLLETLRLSEADFTKDANPQTVQKEKETRNLLSLKTTKLTELLSSNADQSEIDKVDDERRSLENELETIKADLKQQSPIYSAIKNPPPFNVAEFQKNVLDEKTVLLEFALGEKESYLWLITKNEVSSYVLPARNIIENRIDKLLETFEAKQSLSVDSPEVYLQKNEELDNFFVAESKLLSNDLLGQVVDKLTDKRLIIVPDGKLSLLPISALPSPNSDELMIVNNEIVYEPSASLLNILPTIQTNKQLPTKDLLVFADPVFSNTDTRFTQNTEVKNNISEVLGLNLRDFRIVDSNGVIKRLPASQKEAESIAETVGSLRTEIATGFAANRERVIQSNISDYRMLHFATHGLIDVKRPEVSSIVLSTLDENGNNIEGYLRLQDIYSLNLASDLVVLSACESGVGKEVKGEGLMSMNNAFLQAGAKSVVSSAWKVDDNATAQLMSSFYSNLIDKGLTPSEALRQAQIKLSKSAQYKSPFFWAAFTVQGEFKQSISLSTNYFKYVLFGFLGIVGFILLWRVSKLKNYWTIKE